MPEPGRGPRPAAGGAAAHQLRTAALVFVAAAAGTAVCGIPAGLAWAALAPRVLLQVVSRGTAEVVNAETTAFVVADAWFCLITALGGVLTGTLGYLTVVHRRGAAAATGLITGALSAALLALWAGDNSGLAAFRHRLMVSAPGTRLDSSLALGATSALAFWPMFTALVIALGEVAVRSRTSRAARQQASAAAAGAAADQPGDA